MNLEFIESGPALLVRNTQDVLVIADLHLGIESDLARHGIHFKSRSRQRQEKALACIRETSPDTVLLLGDVKHSIPMTTRQEYRELPDVLSSIRELAELLVTPGNHDIGIERFLKPGELLPKEGAVIDGTGYLHGHMYPDPSLAGHLIICGHHHPLVCLRDEVGCSLRAPAYLFAELGEECFMRPVRERPGKIPADPVNNLIPALDGKVTGRTGRKPRKRKESPGAHTDSHKCESREDYPCNGGEMQVAEYSAGSFIADGGPRSGTRVLFMPAFNELSGFDILKIVGSPTSPLSRCMNRVSCEIYLTDGTYIGPLRTVEEYESG